MRKIIIINDKISFSQEKSREIRTQQYIKLEFALFVLVQSLNISRQRFKNALYFLLSLSVNLSTVTVDNTYGAFEIQYISCQ